MGVKILYRKSKEGAETFHGVPIGFLHWNFLLGIGGGKHSFLATELVHDYTNRSTDLALALQYRISDDATLKSKINGAGALSASLRTRLTEGWSLIASTEFNAKDIYGKVAPRIGVGLEAKI